MGVSLHPLAIPLCGGLESRLEPVEGARVALQDDVKSLVGVKKMYGRNSSYYSNYVLNAKVYKFQIKRSHLLVS